MDQEDCSTLDIPKKVWEVKLCNSLNDVQEELKTFTDLSLSIVLTMSPLPRFQCNLVMCTTLISWDKTMVALDILGMAFQT